LKALELTKDINDVLFQYETKLSLLPYTNKKTKKNIESDITYIKDESLRFNFLTKGVKYFQKHLLRKYAKQIYSEILASRNITLEQYPHFRLISPYLDSPQITKSLTELKNETNDVRKADLLEIIGCNLNNEQASYAYELISNAKITKNKIRSLLVLMPKLNKQQHEHSFNEILDYLTENKGNKWISLRPNLIVSNLNSQQKKRLLIIALEIKDIHVRNRLLAHLFLLLSNKQKNVLLNDVIKAMKHRHGNNITEELDIIAPHLEKKQINSILPALEKDPRLAPAIMPYLSDEKTDFIRNALAYTRSSRDKRIKADYFSCLVPYLDTDIKIKVMQEALYTAPSYMLDRFISAWSQIKYVELNEQLYKFFSFKSHNERREGFRSVKALTPALVHFRGPAIADELYRTITDVTRWWP
jgi:hypothetical protein